jgi:hypothetical protein
MEIARTQRLSLLLRLFERKWSRRLQNNRLGRKEAVGEPIWGESVGRKNLAGIALLL